MCPVVLLALILSFLLLLFEICAALTVAFSPLKVEKLKEGDYKEVNFTVSFSALPPSERYYTVLSQNPDIVEVLGYEPLGPDANVSESYMGTFQLKGKFLGHTKVVVQEHTTKDNGTTGVSDPLPVSVIRPKSALSSAFVISVAVLVSLNYINMGCAMDMEIVKSVLKRPVGPIVGFFSQYLAMPLIAYGVAKLLFTEGFLQLGLFTFGCSPGGGASNMWTVLLKGNLNLSLTMTFLSTIAALGMMPLWLFTLGRTLFHEVSIQVPFRNILTTLIAMLIPLAVGIAFQRYFPKIAAFCKRILAPVSICMIIFIVIFGTYANLYMFKLFTWQVIVAAMMNVWIGFFIGALAAKLSGLSWEDTIAISIETGVQNTGISIVLLGFSLTQPDSDIASVVPVAASIVTPFPPVAVMLFQRLYRRYSSKGASSFQEVGDDIEKRSLATSPSTVSSIASDKFSYGNGRDKF